MKREGEESKARMVKLTQRLYMGKPVTSRMIVQTFGVSWATAKRDMQALQEYLDTVTVKKTVSRHGGLDFVLHELTLRRAA